MTKSNDVTGDRITNALKGDKDKYREGWEAIFGKKDTDEILDKLTRDNDGMSKDSDMDMGLYDNES